MRCTPYLYFKGNCEAALRFYASLGLGEMHEVMRYAGTPMAEREGAAWADKVLHALFEGPGVKFYGADGPDSEAMKGCALLLEPEDVAAGAALFEAMSEGGVVTVPFTRQFWGDHYGNFTDRFGVQWAMNCRAG